MPDRFPDRMEMHPRGRVHGVIRPPGSKSITNRALLVAALARGHSTIEGALDADDTRAMSDCLRGLGAAISWRGNRVEVEGRAGQLLAPRWTLDARASGTTARFVAAASTLADGEVVIDGTVRLRERPVRPLLDVLRDLGGDVQALGPHGGFPVRVRGRSLAGGTSVIDARHSSQFVSAIALAAPYADQPVVLEFLDGLLTSRPYVQTTIEVMAAFGGEARLSERDLAISGSTYQGGHFTVEPDASAAAYPLVAAAITGGRVMVEGISADSTQADIGIVAVLSDMGCAVERLEDGIILTGPVEGLRGVEVDMNDMPDAVLAVAVAAAFAREPTRITNVGNLRVKESDRLAALERELRRLGAGANSGEDYLVVRPGDLHAAEIETYDDHRMAMAFALAGLVVPGVVIKDPGCVEKTWPRYFEDLEHLWEDGGATFGEGGVEPIIVAIDGPGGAGKTTVSRGVAARLGLPHLDTGAFYRAATVATLRAGVDPYDTEVVRLVDRAAFDYRNGTMVLDNVDVSSEIRSAEVTAAVSAVSAIPEVRALLVARQREWVAHHGGSAVIEGRDIGTVVFPEATLKVFLTARPDVRALRRKKELVEGQEPDGGVAADLERRDRFDSTREVSPLRPASDAVELDTSDMSIEQVIDHIIQLLDQRGALRRT